MPQNTAHNQLSGEISERDRTEAWWSRAWLTQLLSDWRIGDRGKLVAVALSALLRGRHGRWLLRRLIVMSVFFVYEYLILVELIAGFLLLAEVAARLILSTSTAQANRGYSADSNSAPDTSGSDGSNRITTARTTGNDGDDRTRPNREGQRQQEAIQNNLQRLAMAAAAADATEVAANVAPSLLPDHQRGCQTIEYLERNGILAVTTFNTGSNSQATVTSPIATVNTGRNSQPTAASPGTRATATARQTPRNTDSNSQPTATSAIATVNTSRNSQATAASPGARAKTTSRRTPRNTSSNSQATATSAIATVNTGRNSQPTAASPGARAKRTSRRAPRNTSSNSQATATSAIATVNTGRNSRPAAASPGARATATTRQTPRNTGSNSQATATSTIATVNTNRNSQATAASPRTRAISRPTPRNNWDLSTIVRSEGPSRGLQEPEQSVVIHLQLPIYVCDLIFWNDIHITLPSLSQPSSPPSGVTAVNRGSRSDASDAAGILYQMKMKMWMEVNRDGATDVGYLNGKKPCKDCLTGSHSVGKRQFDCTYLDGCLDGDLDVHKNTFHAGRKLTILGSNSRLNFKFQTTLEQTLARHGSTSPASVKQRATFALLAQIAKLEGQDSTGQQKLSKVNAGSSPKGQRGSISGLLAGVFRKNSAFIPVAKCSVEAVYILEDRRLITGENCKNSQLGLVQNGLDGRLFGSTIASSS